MEKPLNPIKKRKITKTISISPVFDNYLFYIKSQTKKKESDLIQQGLVLASQILHPEETLKFYEWAKETGLELTDFVNLLAEVSSTINPSEDVPQNP